MRPTTPSEYYGWWLYDSNRELLCQSDLEFQFQTIEECSRNLERVKEALPDASVGEPPYEPRHIKPMVPYFVIFHHPVDPTYYLWLLVDSNGEYLCTNGRLSPERREHHFRTMDECKRNIERVKEAVPNVNVYYAQE